MPAYFSDFLSSSCWLGCCWKMAVAKLAESSFQTPESLNPTISKLLEVNFQWTPKKGDKLRENLPFLKSVFTNYVHFKLSSLQATLFMKKSEACFTTLCQRKKEKISTAPGRIQTHDLLFTRRSLYCCGVMTVRVSKKLSFLELSCTYACSRPIRTNSTSYLDLC